MNLKISWQKRLTSDPLTEMCMHSCELLRAHFMYRSFLHKAYHSNAQMPRSKNVHSSTNKCEILETFFWFSVFFSFSFTDATDQLWWWWCCHCIFTYRYSHFLWANMHDEIVSLGRTIHYKYWLWLQLEAVTCVCLALKPWKIGS